MNAKLKPTIARQDPTQSRSLTNWRKDTHSIPVHLEHDSPFKFKNKVHVLNTSKGEGRGGYLINTTLLTMHLHLLNPHQRQSIEQPKLIAKRQQGNRLGIGSSGL
jgi:hypothetical protein